MDIARDIEFEDTPPQPSRSRPRVEGWRIQPAEIAKRVADMWTEDVSARTLDTEQRLQRWAKYRGWTEGKDWPWDGASDVVLPDMMEKSMRMQDTLVNAFLAVEPPIGSIAKNKANRDKQEKVDNLLNHQFFREADGEEMICEMAEAFVNDGVMISFTPWVTERRDVLGEVLLFEPIPDDMAPGDYTAAIVNKIYFGLQAEVLDGDGWEWSVFDAAGEELRVSFYTDRDENVEMVPRALEVVYDGPKPMCKDYSEVWYPTRAANLQIPGPSNPGGAAHVILVDYPSVDEIKRLVRDGYYDMVDAEAIKNLDAKIQDPEYDYFEEQKDDFAGFSNVHANSTERGHNTVTRLMCFDMFDVDGDGIEEDVIWWALREDNILLKAAYLGEMFPGSPPQRPVRSKSLFPVNGRVAGISYLEMSEGLHDVTKQLTDQAIDGGTLAQMPFFFYRPLGNLKNETMRMGPGEGIPVNNPSQDVYMPNFNNSAAQGFHLNMITLLQQWEEKVTMIGDVQLGRVPPGRSSALRTTPNMQLIAGQGEARPERVLRRFFSLFTGVWQDMHRLNKRFLPPGKQIEMIGFQPPGEDPYLTIVDRADIDGDYRFDFKANILNTSKSARQEALGALMQTYLTELALQLGVIDPNGAYKLLRDFGRSLGQDVDQYLKPPTPDAAQPAILAEEALTSIYQGIEPAGVPAEAGGAMEHLQKLIMFAESDQFGLFGPEQVQMLQIYLQQVMARAQAQQQQMMLQQAAGQMQMGGGGQPGAPASQPMPADAMAPPQVSSGNELMDETLPTAGGGGQP